MMKDIPVRRVEGVAVAIAPLTDDPEESHLEVFIINLKNEPLEHVLVASRGYGEREGEEIKTSVLRHYYELIPARTACKVENIYPELSDINHEFWVSFSLDNFLFDRKYTFVPGSISDDLFGSIPLLGRKGVMIG